MKYIRLVFSPTPNRRLNELVGFLLLVCAGLLFLALASYSPLDPSLNTAGRSPSVQAPHNWIGMVGAFSSDLLLQTFGVAIFLWPIALGMLGMRWWRSQPVNSPLPKLIGAAALLTFTSALFGLLPWHWRWLHAVPIEGIAGRIVGDFLIHYFNLTGAYIISLSVMAAAMYVSTAFSFNALQLWCETRFAFAYALHNRF
jgi:S-DNA-T family DNA segregation ATPase FtsK/SpoIIIE